MISISGPWETVERIWLEKTDTDPQARWRAVQRDATGDESGAREDMPTVPGVSFLRVVNGRHRCKLDSELSPAATRPTKSLRPPTKQIQAGVLPSALWFWEGEFGSLGWGGKGWRRVLCPFHRDRHPSLSVNTGSGGFYCFACGAKGGDLVAYVMLRDGVDFKTAAQMLNAWRQAGDTPQEHLEWIGQECKRDRIRLAAARLESAERELRLSVAPNFTPWNVSSAKS